MPPLAGVGAEPAPKPPSATSPVIDEVLDHAGARRRRRRLDALRRARSAAIGHYIRLVHEGRMTPDEGWEAICQYNAAMLRPCWPLER